MFDWRQLKRWDISEDKLPAGSVVRFREVSVWDRYRRHIIGITFFCFLEALLIVVLLIQRVRRSRAEQEISRSEAKFEAIFKNMPMPMLLLDQDRHVLEVNRAAREIVTLSTMGTKGIGFGNAFRCIYSLDDPGGCGFGPACHGCTVRRIVTDTFQTGRSYYQAEAKLTSLNIPQPQDNYLLVSTVLLDFARDCNVLLCLEDITKQRHAELETQNLRNELTHIARQTTLGELTASFAHEIKQPLTAILSNAQAAQRFLSGKPPDIKELQEILQDIVKDDKRASGIIQRLRTLAKKDKPVFASLDLNKTVGEVVSLVNTDLSFRRFQMATRLSDGLPLVRAGRDSTAAGGPQPYYERGRIHDGC